MCIWLINRAFYELEEDQSTPGILGWPAKLQLILELQKNLDLVDHSESNQPS